MYARGVCDYMAYPLMQGLATGTWLRSLNYLWTHDGSVYRLLLKYSIGDRHCWTMY